MSSYIRADLYNLALRAQRQHAAENERLRTENAELRVKVTLLMGQLVGYDASKASSTPQKRRAV